MENNSAATNPYNGGDVIVFNLCHVTRAQNDKGRDESEPGVDYTSRLLTISPAGEVTVKNQTGYTEKKNKATGATVVEMKKYDDPTDVEFSVELLTDESGEGGETALMKLELLYQSFRTRDQYGEKYLFAPDHPQVPKDIKFVFWDSLTHNDSLGADCIVARILLRQWFYNAPQKKKSTGARRAGTGSSVAAAPITPAEQMRDHLGAYELWDKDADDFVGDKGILTDEGVFQTVRVLPQAIEHALVNDVTVDEAFADYREARDEGLLAGAGWDISSPSTENESDKSSDNPLTLNDFTF